jgi:hypothetical protein
MDEADWDDNQFPLAYLITIRCYGTWLHVAGICGSRNTSLAQFTMSFTSRATFLTLTTDAGFSPGCTLPDGRVSAWMHPP